MGISPVWLYFASTSANVVLLDRTILGGCNITGYAPGGTQLGLGLGEGVKVPLVAGIVYGRRRPGGMALLVDGCCLSIWSLSGRYVFSSLCRC